MKQSQRLISDQFATDQLPLPAPLLCCLGSNSRWRYGTTAALLIALSNFLKSKIRTKAILCHCTVSCSSQWGSNGHWRLRGKACVGVIISGIR